MTKISNCGHDERGKYSGGAAGDQGGEYVIKDWYSRPWNVVLRHPDEKVRTYIASMAKAAANNNCIGYDQSQRHTFWEQLVLAKYRVKDIKNKCEADCSSSTASIVKAVGYRLGNEKLKAVSIGNTTWTLKDALKKAGFRAYTAQKYTSRCDYLLPGDILLNEQHHVAINVTKGDKA